MDVVDRLAPERAWTATVVALLVVLVVGSLAFPAVVYDRFVWQYFWGPVYADAQGAVCAVKHAAGVELLGSTGACAGATGIVAYPGYTLVSEVGYAVTLLLAIVGVVFLLRRLDVGRDRGLFFALVPFMFFGGALRVVEDATHAIPVGAPGAVTYPANALIISPLIYFTVFFVTLGAVVASVWLARAEAVARYEHPLLAFGTLLLVGTIAYLGWLAVTTTTVGFHPQIPAVILVATTALAAAIWVGIDRYAPDLNRGTGRMGAVIIWGHTLDGVANVVAIDWGAELGLAADLVPKHPVNRALIAVGQQFPDAVTGVIGTAWPFLVVKLVAAVVIIWVFDEAIFEDSPRFSILLVIAVVAVGLGPGTRDMLRATFGV